jgi:BlaR1 peptidase M56
METFLIYLLKSSALMAAFYLLYHFLVQKETFFNSSRWFLLAGLFTSALMPLFFIERIVFIEKQPININNVSHIVNDINPENFPVDNSFNWFEILNMAYFIVVFILLSIIVANVFSLYKLLYKKQIEVKKPFALVDINENINPFSFFKYIVFNSNLYSKKELESILNHEKVHSREKHSIDVIIAKVFCAIFWFNPFVWLYKKAILQNLEYIADQKAIENIEDKKAYQMTLLKVVTDQNCLSITNNFYQSLIKKRIVMLNKNESKQRNVWKYAVIIPILVAFVAFFQVKVIAQEKLVKLDDGSLVSKTTQRVTEVTITKNSTDAEIEKDCKLLKKDFNVDLKVTNVKRNTKNEITSISINANNNKGSKSTHDVESDEAITPFMFSIKRDLNGNDRFGFYNNPNSRSKINENELVDNFESDNNDYPEMPSPPTPPTPPNAPDMSNMPTPPSAPNFPTPPTVKAPKDPNDAKAWKKYEAAMEKFGQEWENSPEIKKYQEDMEAYGREMEKYQPDMSAFEKEMEKFEVKMEAYEKEMEAYHDKISDENPGAFRDNITSIRDNMTSKRDQMTAKRDLINAKRDAMNAKRDAQKAKLVAERARKNADR